jgi:hypothetical protein
MNALGSIDKIIERLEVIISFGIKQAVYETKGQIEYRPGRSGKHCYKRNQYPDIVTENHQLADQPGQSQEWDAEDHPRYQIGQRASGKEGIHQMVPNRHLHHPSSTHNGVLPAQAGYSFLCGLRS